MSYEPNYAIMHKGATSVVNSVYSVHLILRATNLWAQDLGN